MRQSVEAYFLMNLTVDAALLAVIARANGCFRPRRALLGGLLCAAYALLVENVSGRLGHPVVQLLLIVPVALIVSGDHDWRKWGSVAFQLFCGAMMLGGLGTLMSRGGVSPTAVVLGAGLLLLNMLLNVRASRIITWEVTVCLYFRGRNVSFRALIDTGNRLREPISGQPVLIAESSLLKELIHSANGDDFPGRRVAFGGLGGGGTVRCFRPDMVLIRRGDQLIRAPEVWVAVYPGKIPGTSRALAPPSFAVIPGKS